jgi:hypothetical protein
MSSLLESSEPFVTCGHTKVGLKDSAGILEPFMGARKRVGIEFSDRLARLHRLADSIPWNRFLGSIKVLKYRIWGLETLVKELNAQDKKGVGIKKKMPKGQRARGRKD